MKQRVYNFINTRWRIFGISVVNTFNIETAYPAENWSNIISTLFYTASYLLFIKIIFGNVHSLAGYSLNDMLFYAFVGQLAFYTLFSWSYENMSAMIDDIRFGNFDLILIKPVPTLFFVSTQKIAIFSLIRDAILPMTMIGLLINWHELNVSALSIFYGVIVFICGQWAMHFLQFVLCLPVFWQGQSNALLNLVYTLTNIDVPFEGLPKTWKVIFTTILPIGIAMIGTTSVILNKGNTTYLLSISITIAIIVTFLRYYLWKKALNAYNSASS